LIAAVIAASTLAATAEAQRFHGLSDHVVFGAEQPGALDPTDQGDELGSSLPRAALTRRLDRDRPPVS
jgi:hypothetical protein